MTTEILLNGCFITINTHELYISGSWRGIHVARAEACVTVKSKNKHWALIEVKDSSWGQLIHIPVGSVFQLGQVLSEHGIELQ